MLRDALTTSFFIIMLLLPPAFALGLSAQSRDGWKEEWSDDFSSYETVDDMQHKGWTIPILAGVRIDDGQLVLEDVGGQLPFVQKYYPALRIEFPIYSWAVEDTGAWVGGNVGTFRVKAIGSAHQYEWWIDGVGERFHLTTSKQGQNPMTLDYGPYTPVKNANVTLRIEKIQDTLRLYCDGKLISNYLETDVGLDPLSGVEIGAGHESRVRYHNILVEKLLVPFTLTETTTIISTAMTTLTVPATVTSTSTTVTTAEVCAWYSQPYVIGSAILGICGIIGVIVRYYLIQKMKERTSRRTLYHSSEA